MTDNLQSGIPTACHLQGFAWGFDVCADCNFFSPTLLPGIDLAQTLQSLHLTSFVLAQAFG